MGCRRHLNRLVKCGTPEGVVADPDRGRRRAANARNPSLLQPDVIRPRTVAAKLRYLELK